MDLALRSILCSESSWQHAIPWSVCISFNEDGTGELWAVGDIGVFVLACNLDWKSVGPSTESDTAAREPPRVGSTSFWSWAEKPQHLGTLHLEITLHPSLAKTWVERMPTARYTNEMNLSDAAFQTRSFTVVVEKGNFMSEDRVGEGRNWSRYGLRLVFDKSPYPPREAFKDNEGYGPDLQRWATDLNATSTFLARSLPESSRKVRAMNDNSIMG